MSWVRARDASRLRDLLPKKLPIPLAIAPIPAATIGAATIGILFAGVVGVVGPYGMVDFY
tara:strand:+ start:1023 stop:1202 length:180 start_codon:yes stop_codon:yes gene_type:complete